MNACLPSLLLDQSFEDPYSCGEAVSWDLDFRQLAPGKLDAQVTVIGSDDVQIVRFCFNAPFHQLGTPPVGSLAFGFTSPDSPHGTHFGEEIRQGSMLKMSAADGLDSVSAAGFIGYAVVLNEEHLSRVWEQLHLAEMSDSLTKGSTQRQSENTLAIGKMLRALFSDVLEQKDRPPSEFTGLINEDVVFAIASELKPETTKIQSIRGSYKVKSLRRALEILNDEQQLPISVADLCVRAGVSSSSLNRIFLAEFGLSPKAYIRTRCLSAVRDELSCAPPDSRVSDIANKWGFWHMGQFAGDFRRLFGELPSRYLVR